RYVAGSRKSVEPENERKPPVDGELIDPTRWMARNTEGAALDCAGHMPHTEGYLPAGGIAVTTCAAPLRCQVARNVDNLLGEHISALDGHTEKGVSRVYYMGWLTQ